MKSNNHDLRHRSINRWGVFWICLLTCAFVALGGRVVYIQAAMSPRLLEYRDRQQRWTVSIPARRGLILDTKGRVLAGSESRPSVFADPKLISDIDLTSAKLAPILGTSQSAVRERIESRQGTRFCWLARKITPSSADAVRDQNLPGIGLITEPHRFYPNGFTLAHVLGFVNRESKGLEGLELEYDDTLRGTAGRYAAKCDVRRRPLWPELERICESQDGDHIVLTIDLVIQGYLEKAVERAVHEFQAESGVGVVMSPRSGDIVAMTSFPTFDPNTPQDFPIASKRNRCLTDPVEPGSIFKPFTMAGALAEGVADLDEKIDCGSGVWYFKTGKSTRRLRDTHANGVLTFEEIVVKSSNIGMGRIGERLGNRRLHRYVTAFGFGNKTGIDLPGESRGIVLPLRRWNSYSTTSIPMGQEVAVTPLQLITAFSALACGGELPQPRIVRRILKANGQEAFDVGGSRGASRIVPESVARAVAQRVLVRMVNDSHHDIKLEDYQMLGKTGTAQVPYRNRPGYEPDAYVSSFVGAAPAHDPQVAALVMIRRPRKSIGYYGGKVAGPAVKEVIARTLAYWRIPPDSDIGPDHTEALTSNR